MKETSDTKPRAFCLFATVEIQQTRNPRDIQARADLNSDIVFAQAICSALTGPAPQGRRCLSLSPLHSPLSGRKSTEKGSEGSLEQNI